MELLNERQQNGGAVGNARVFESAVKPAHSKFFAPWRENQNLSFSPSS